MALLTLSACASAPEKAEDTAAPEPIGVDLDATAAAPATTADMTPAPGPATAPPEPTVVGLTPEQYPDLFDRLRAGYRLEDVESVLVDRQFNYYVNNPDYLDRVFNRAGLYLHFIVTEIERRGMPMELALLPVVESAFEPYAYSRARASGLWQFIPGTGNRFGLKQNWWYDGRRDVIESTRAALDYLQFLHDEFNGDWLLAIAGYNCGESCVTSRVRAVEATGVTATFWNVRPRLPRETQAYVPKLLAMARLVANPGDYGIEFSRIPNEPYFALVDTSGQIDMKLAAELAGIPYEELYELNPAFHRWATDPSGPHRLLVPYESADLFRVSLAQLTPDERMRVQHHRVESGDTLTSVAARYGTQAHVVRELNGLGANARLVVGDDLRVPSGVTELPAKVRLAAARVDRGTAAGGGKRGTVHVVRRGDTLSHIARRNRMSVTTLAALNDMDPNDTLRTGQRLIVSRSGASRGGGSSGSPNTYTIRKGDTLSGIARKFGVSVSQLTSWNGISTQTVLRPGRKLTIRRRG